MPQYCVVDFVEENTIGVISSKWLTDGGRNCFWPSGPNSNSSNLAKNHVPVGKKWIKFPCTTVASYGMLSTNTLGTNIVIYRYFN